MDPSEHNRLRAHGIGIQWLGVFKESPLIKYKDALQYDIVQIF